MSSGQRRGFRRPGARVAALLAVAAVVTACVIYTAKPEQDPRVSEARGLTGRLYLDNTRFLNVELLWGDSTGYLVLQPGDSGRVIWAPAERVREVWFPVSELVQARPKTAAQLEALRGASRFPFGVNPRALEQIMAQRGQSSVDTLEASTTRATAPFLDEARAGTAKYRSTDAAVADGFKPVGTEFPFMGEHWVNLPRVLENRFDASQPSVLIYVNTAKGRELAGVGYTALLGAGEKPPVSPAPETAWHEHNGSVVEESLPGLHDGGQTGGHDGGHKSGQTGGHDGGHKSGQTGGQRDVHEGLRLSVMHAWIWIENPDGAFTTDNRALPFARAGATPRTISVAALRGLTLAQDSAGYYLQTLRTSLDANADESAALERAISAAQRRSAGSDTQRSATWDSLWIDLDRALALRREDLLRVRAVLER